MKILAIPFKNMKEKACIVNHYVGKGKVEIIDNLVYVVIKEVEKDGRWIESKLSKSSTRSSMESGGGL